MALDAWAPGGSSAWRMGAPPGGRELRCWLRRAGALALRARGRAPLQSGPFRSGRRPRAAHLAAAGPAAATFWPSRTSPLPGTSTQQPRPAPPPPAPPCSDAEDAVRGRDGYDFYGNRLRVELAKGAGGGMGGRGGGRGFGGAPPPGFRPRQTGFRVLVKGLPMSASWQDVKVGAGQGGGGGGKAASEGRPPAASEARACVPRPPRSPPRCSFPPCPPIPPAIAGLHPPGVQAGVHKRVPRP